MKEGLDAPLIPLSFLGVGICGMVWAVVSREWVNFIYPVSLLVVGGVYLRTSLVGKKRILQRIVAQMKLTETVKILDLGTGHGAFLIEIAKKLTPPAKAIGIDIWKKGDQLHNSLIQTETNIEKLSLTDVCEVKTADMTQLPFGDRSFDYVVSSLALHNLKTRTKRELALAEAYRVLKPGGTLIVVDIEHTVAYQRYLAQLGMQELSRKHAGFDGMYGLMGTKILVAKKEYRK